jgi:membrane-associated phospholipid phosphatase
MKRFAYYISQVLHPFTVEIFTFLFLCFTSTENGSDVKIIIISVLPGNLVLFSALYLKFTGQLSDFNGIIRHERLLLISLGAIYHGIGFFILNYYDAPQLIQGLMFCYALNTAIVWLITNKWKISIHAIGLGGPLVALWFNGVQYPFLMLSMMVILCLSRIALNAHTPMQVIAGSIFSLSFAYFQLKHLFLML